MRGLLCGTQSSKEQLRRSRTESSGAAPAIEELAGEARQVRPAGPRADQYQPTLFFSRAGRSGGRPALQLPRPTFTRGSLHISPAPDRAPQKPEIPASVPAPPIEEVWRATGPPAPTTNIHARQPAYLPRSRPRTTEVGTLPPGTVLARPPVHRKPDIFPSFFRK